MEKYPRFITSEFSPFDPVELARETEKIVCKDDQRKYTDFYATGVYSGIATGYTVGCALRCIYCWVSLSRDFPEKYGNFYSPEEVVQNLERAARRYGTHKCRISGGEPTLGKEHLLKILELVESNDWFDMFILETNGILFGVDRDYVRELAKFVKPHVRLCFKAGTPEGFQTRTGAIGKFYELPFKALRNLLDYGISCHCASMSERRIMPPEERKILIKKIEQISPRLAMNLEEEVVDGYSTTLFRMKSAGVDLKDFFEKKKPIY